MFFVALEADDDVIIFVLIVADNALLVGIYLTEGVKANLLETPQNVHRS